MYQLIEQARAAYDDLDEQSVKIPKDDHLQRRLNLAHQRLLWDYQEPIAQAASFLKPRDMGDVLAMLKLMEDRLEDLVENDHEANAFDVDAELSSLRRMVRGCLPVVAAELGAELGKSTRRLCDAAFAEVPR
jgi:hypothetical protein